MDRLAETLKYCKNREAVRGAGADKPGRIYMIRCNQFVKLGIASSVSLRLANLQVGCPYPLRLLRSWRTDTTKQHERRLHHTWRMYHERGEWHEIPPEYVAALSACKTIEEALAIQPAIP